MLNFSIGVFWLIDAILLVGGLLLMLFGGFVDNKKSRYYPFKSNASNKLAGAFATTFGLIFLTIILMIVA